MAYESQLYGVRNEPRLSCRMNRLYRGCGWSWDIIKNKLLLSKIPKLKGRLWNVGRGSIACTKCFGQIPFSAFEPCVLPAEACVFTHVFMESKKQKFKSAHQCCHFYHSPENVSILHAGHLKKSCSAMFLISLTLTRILWTHPRLSHRISVYN